MTQRTILGAALRAIREAKAATDPQFRGSTFAIVCGMSHAHLCNIEAGRKFPPAETIERLAKALGEPVEAISYVAGEGATA